VRLHCRQALLTLLSLWLIIGVNSGQAQLVPLAGADTPWRYNKSGVNLGTAWTQPDYNDSAEGWEGPGVMLFGFETTPAEYAPLSFSTVFPDPSTQSPFVTNYYFRAHFTVAGITPAALAAAKLITANVVDDGSVLYLNGTEVFRFNMPTGAITATSFSSFGLSGEGWPPLNSTVFFRTNMATNLVVGDNVLAVEVHQGSTTSSDVVFGMLLFAVPPTPLVLTEQPVSQTNVIGSMVTFAVRVTGTDPVYQWYSNNVALLNATQSSYSAVARATIVSDTLPVRMIFVAGGVFPDVSSLSNRVLVCFDKRLVRASAANSQNYTI